MTATATIREWWQPYFKQGYDRRVTLLGREGVKVSDFTLPVWRALEAALQANGYGTASIVSTYYPRLIADTDDWSTHSFSGVAIDVDPYGAGNPFPKDKLFSWNDTKFTPEQVAAVKAIRTVSGAQVWRWGGDSFGKFRHDYMHWQLDCRPADIVTGIQQEDDDMKYMLQIFNLWTVEDLQKMKDAGYWGGDPSWYYGPSVTDEAKVNLVVYVLANGNKDIPGNAGQGPAGPQGPAGVDGKTPVIDVTYE